ncbi:MAG TPA: fused MFS/spermidine synthase [Fimbriimonas sp.]
MRALFTLTIFVGSFLLFLVQPMVAKMILPTFGGSPQVWNSAMLFFQLVLLLGYLYAHWAPKLLGKYQPWVHLGLLAAAALTLPFAADNVVFRAVQGSLSSPESDGTGPQALLVLFTLGGLVGLPFFVLSSGASLLQRWFSFTNDAHAKDPYFLYSASNVGSLLGLFAYPFLLEPRLVLPAQSRVWFYGYLVLLGLVALCVAGVAKYVKVREADVPAVVSAEDQPRPKLLWTLLAAVPSSLMLGVTTYLTSNVAPVPLLWVIPLALYLLTFIFAFARWGTGMLPTLARMLPLLVTPLAVAIILDAAQPIVMLGFFHLAVFFVAAWMCHSRLVSLRPEPRHLTEFYFYMALGGALGGAFNSLVAPVAFNYFYEYPLALVAACLLRPMRPEEKTGRWDLLYPAIVAAITVGLITAGKAGAFAQLAERMDLAPAAVRTGITLGVPLILCFFAVDRTIRFGLALGAVMLSAVAMRPTADSTVLLTERSFFGIHRITTPDRRFYNLVHGNTIHGMQDRENPGVPLTYYHPTGPIGQLIGAYDRLHNVALVGLGVGSIAAYGRPGLKMTYFEIDPEVERIARDPEYFTFLRDSPSKPSVVIGDARLTLSRSPDRYDLIVLDAFSSDAIPVHLLTREAMQMYLQRLNPGGLIAFHISNRYLSLEDTLAATGASLGLSNLFQLDPALPDEQMAGKSASSWIVFGRTKADVKTLAGTNGAWGPQEPGPEVKVWTDDFSNVLSVFNPEQ